MALWYVSEHMPHTSKSTAAQAFEQIAHAKMKLTYITGAFVIIVKALMLERREPSARATTYLTAFMSNDGCH